jgi:hypothetical protein
MYTARREITADNRKADAVKKGKIKYVKAVGYC